MSLGSSHDLIIVNGVYCGFHKSFFLTINKLDHVKPMEHDSFALELWDLFSYTRVTSFFMQKYLQNLLKEGGFFMFIGDVIHVWLQCIENASMDRHSYASTSISLAKGSGTFYTLVANHSQASSIITPHLLALPLSLLIEEIGLNGTSPLSTHIHKDNNRLY